MRKYLLTLFFVLLTGLVFASFGLGGGVLISQATSTMLYQGNVFLGFSDYIALDLQVIDFSQFVPNTYLLNPYVELVLPLTTFIEVYGGAAPIFSYNTESGFSFEDLYFAKVGGRLIFSPLSVYGEGQFLMSYTNGSLEAEPKPLLSVGAMLFFK